MSQQEIGLGWEQLHETIKAHGGFRRDELAVITAVAPDRPPASILKGGAPEGIYPDRTQPLVKETDRVPHP